MGSVFQHCSILSFTKSNPKKIGKEAFEVKKSFSFSLDKILMGTRSRAQTLVPFLLAMVAWLDFNSKSNKSILLHRYRSSIIKSKFDLIKLEPGRFPKYSKFLNCPNNSLKKKKENIKYEMRNIIDFAINFTNSWWL